MTICAAAVRLAGWLAGVRGNAAVYSNRRDAAAAVARRRRVSMYRPLAPSVAITAAMHVHPLY